jgi:hypothetical protein
VFIDWSLSRKEVLKLARAQRALVLDYLEHNCYFKTAEVFARDSCVRQLDADGDETMSGRGEVADTTDHLEDDTMKLADRRRGEPWSIL